MLLDATTLDDGAELSADVCIVGAGAAGIAIARELIGSGLSVLLLEGGALEESDDSQDIYRGTMTGLSTWELHRTRVRIFGGTTYHWAGYTMPLQPEDFEARDHIAGSGWPVTYEELAPYYLRAATVLEIGTSAWDPDGVVSGDGANTVPAMNGDIEQRFYKFSPPTRMGTVYRSEIVDATDVTAYYRAAITNIVLDDSESEVDHLEGRVFGEESKQFRVTASHYVLAMGGIENPRLLLASNSQLAAGVANSSDAVGRYFMEHPHLYSVGGLTLPSDFDMAFYRRHGSTTAAIDILGGVGLSASTRAELGLLDLTMELAGDASSTDELNGVSPDDADAFVRREGESTFYRIHLRAEQSPQAESRVTLSDTDVDVFGVPRVQLNWHVADTDLTSYRRSLEVLGAELGVSGLGRAFVPADDEGTLTWSLQPGSHHMGTTRMSETAADGVVDANCKTHDVDNLYIAGSSVFRTAGSANPTLTLVALALRLADHLKEAEAS